MNTKKRHHKRRVGRKTKRGGGVFSRLNFFGKKEPEKQVMDWDGKPEGDDYYDMDKEYEEKYNQMMQQYDKEDAAERMKAKKEEEIRHKKNITNNKTIDDVTSLMESAKKPNFSCREYDEYISSNKQDYYNYKEELDKKINQQNKQNKSESSNKLSKCTWSMRLLNPFKWFRSTTQKQIELPKNYGGKRRTKKYKKSKINRKRRTIRQ